MRVDVVITWLGAAGVLAYLGHIHGRRTRSFLERRMLALLYCLTALLTVRGFFWLYGGAALRALTFGAAALLPLVATLFVEALLRRHAPPSLKWTVAAGTLVFLAGIPLSLGPGGQELYFHGLSGYMTLTLAWLSWLLLARRRDALAPAENAFIEGVMVAAALGVLFALTDFRLRPDWLDLRLGGLGGLVFVYACVRLSRPTTAGRPGGRLAVEAAAVAVKTLALAAAFAVIAGGLEPRGWVAAVATAFGFVLLLSILDRLHTLGRGQSEDSFRRWLSGADLGSFSDLLARLDRLPLAERHLVVTEAELQGYDAARMAAAFEETPVWTLPALRAAAAEAEDPAPPEQLIDLLEGLDMRQVVLLRRRPPTLLLIHLPEVATAEEWLLDLGLLSRVARLAAGEGDRA